MTQVDSTSDARPSVDSADPEIQVERTGLGAWAALAARPIGIYLASRAVVGTAMWLASRIPPPTSLNYIVTTWDASWYLDTARLGYPHALPMVDGHVAQSTLAFFPFFPLCMRALHALGFSYQVSGLLVAGVAGIAAVVLMWFLLRRMWGDGAADRGVALFCFFPGAFVLSMVYAEALMLSLTIGCLLALLSRRWVLAGVLGAVATATTSHALAVVPACAWVAAVAIWQRREWRALAAPLLSPLGFVGFQLFLWDRTGVFDAYTQTHEAWGVRINPLVVWGQFRDFLRRPLVDMNVTVAVVGAIVVIVTLALLVRARPPVPVLLYTLFALFPVVVSEGLGARPRFVLTAFPLLAVLGRRLQGNTFAVLLAGSATLLGCFTVLSIRTGLATP
jgi:hypothetical protein